MTPREFQRVDEVFRAAVAVAEAGRSAYLDEACGEDEHIRARVESLLARDADPHRLLAFEPAETEGPERDFPMPARVGPYRILGVLGAGAMGVVYRAEQENPRRIVALKLMRSNLTGARGLRRFHQEAELLGRIQHPGVAHVIEAGTTTIDGQSGAGAPAQPFIVMEFVDGRPLLEHIRHHALGVRARIELLVRICDAVEHAHFNGIVHRDLKPANILVTEAGTSSSRSAGGLAVIGQPKVLDFGVARIMDADRAGGTAHTRAGELVGTLPYMSPEQISGDPDAIDMRCDVYALGVILFEMLTGARPHDVTGKSLAEAARIICEDPPIRLRSLDRRLPGDLDTIVATAIEKDLGRRYGSIAVLAGDLRRYLQDEPILARRPTTLYQLRKFTRRNRGLVTGVVAALVMLVIGLVASAALYARAEGRAEMMRRALYARRITVGQNALDAGDAREVPDLLKACPEDLRHWEWDRLHMLSDRSARTFRGHTGRVNDVAFGPEDRFLVTAGGYDDRIPPEARETSVRVWDPLTGRGLGTIGGHINPIQSVAVSPDGKMLATLSRTRFGYGEPRDGRLRLWRLDTLALEADLLVHPEFGTGLCFSQDGRALYVGGALGPVARVDVGSWDVAWSAGDPRHVATDVALTPDGREVVGSEWSGEVSVWDAESGELRWSRKPHGDVVVLGVAISADGAAIATASKDRTVRILDRATGEERLALPDVGAHVLAVAFAPGGELITGAEDGVIRRYDSTTGARRADLLGHEDAVKRLVLSRDGAVLASAGADGTAKLWRLDAPPPDAAWSPHGENEVNHVAWHPGGDLIATSGDDGHARITDVRTGMQRMAVRHESRYITHVEWSADGGRLVTLDSHGGIRLWDAGGGDLRAEWQGHDNWSFCGAFHPDGSRIVSGGRGQLRVWNGETGALVHELDPGATDVRAVAWSPDGARLVHASLTGEVVLWDAAQGRRLAVLAARRIPVECVAFHPDGTWIAFGDRAGYVHVLDWRRNRPVYTVEAHTASCESIAFSPDGARLLAGGGDGTLRLLEASTGDHLLTLKEHRSGVVSVSFSPDGRQIASTSRDFTARIWNAATAGENGE